MSKKIINNGDTGAIIRAALNANFTELYSNNRVRSWVRSFRGVHAAPSFMASPPTISRATASTITSATAGACSHAWTHSALTFLGSPVVSSSYGAKSEAASQLDGSKVQGGIMRIRFATDAPAIELVSGYWQQGLLGLIIDGQVAFARSPVNQTTANALYTKFDFGTNTQAYQLVQANISAGGTGYAEGDEITLTGGAVVKVVRIQTGSTPSELMVVNGGSMASAPSNPIAQVSTTGSGTGLIVNGYFGTTHTTRKLRYIEILTSKEVYVKGINVDARSVVLPWAAPASLPKLLIVGDSQQEGAYLEAAGAQMGVRIAQRLGLYDRLFISAKSGTGWNTDFGQQARWSHANRIADVVNAAPDIVLHLGSQNDTDNAALKTAVTDALNTMATSLPDTIFIGCGSAISNLSTNIKAGYEAATAYGSRISYVDDVTVPVFTGTGNIVAPSGSGNRDWYLTNDNTHLSRAGTDLIADARAPRIANAIIGLVG